MFNLNGADPKSLARVLGISRVREFAWAESEYAAILTHQLDTALTVDLLGANPALLASYADRLGRAATFRDLLINDPNPPVELLEQTKNFAKEVLHGRREGIPDDIARVLYYAAIVAAHARCGRRISELDNASLEIGVLWALERAWIDSQSKMLFREGMAVVQQGRNDSLP